MARSLHCRAALLPEGWRHDVRFDLDDSGIITGWSAAAPGAGDDILGGWVVPGMANLHSHGFQRLMAGLTGLRGERPDSFWTWREAMYRLALRIDPDQFQNCMAGVYLEMLRSGYTACAEFHYLHHATDGMPYSNPAELSERVFAAATTTGIALMHLPVLYMRAGFNAAGVAPEQRRFANSLETYQGIFERCEQLARACGLWSTGVAPHSLRAVHATGLHAVLDLAGPAKPVHLHVAEQPREVEECRAALGASPVAWLLEHLPVDRRWCLVHATHMSPAERRSAAASGAVAGLCPTTEADLGDGVFDAVGWLADGGAFGIGSDSNLRICPVEELRSLEFSQRLALGRRNVLAAPGQSCGLSLYAAAAAGGGQALGQRIGRLAEGWRADLVELDAGHPMLEGLNENSVLDTWLFAGGRDMVRSVWVGGNRVVDAGHHANEGNIDDGFQRVLRELRG